MPCIQSVHLTSHFKYRGAKGMTHYVCSLMLRYWVDYIRSECAIICYYFPCMNRELFIRAWTNVLLQRICCCSVNDALHGKSMWPIMCTWIWSDRTFWMGSFHYSVTPWVVWIIYVLENYSRCHAQQEGCLSLLWNIKSDCFTHILAFIEIWTLGHHRMHVS